MEVMDMIPRLLGAALGNSELPSLPQMDNGQWQFQLEVLAAQNVHTLVFDVLPASVPHDVREIWENQVKAVERHNALVGSIVAAQEAAWKRENLNYAIVKGPAIAALYPFPSHRGAGDIDWYFADTESWDQAKGIAARNAESPIVKDSDGDVSYLFHGVVIEHHRDWSHLSSRRLRRVAGAPTVSGGCLSPEDTILSLECHILHHLAFKGLCLKQFADLAVALKHYDGQYSREKFVARVSSLGLERWTSLLHSALVRLACLPVEYVPTPAEAQEKDVQRLISVTMCDGVGAQGGKRPPVIIMRRILLMLKYGRAEGLARYFYLVVGKLARRTL